MLRLFIALGADINAKIWIGRAHFEWASDRKNEKDIKLLLELGAVPIKELDDSEEEPSQDQATPTLSQTLCSPITDAPICDHMVDGCIETVKSRAVKAVTIFAATKNAIAAAEVIAGACAFGAIAAGVSEAASNLLGLHLDESE